ncbi:MAG: hypothetical protein JSS70_19995 [Bacteroidetes bacterium]|nr:hypothetical protein [Bacteroidota bacterium]
MLKRYFLYFISCCIALNAIAQQKEMLIYHPIQTDKKGKIIPWYNADPGKSYSHIIGLVWNFWDTMRRDMNGLPYYMNHQVWNPQFNDPRGIGGDQFAMALSSWRLFYAYSGNERVKANMLFIADYYLTHGLSPADCKWPDIPFPYNTYIYSGVYDGDMRSGRDIAQPDKAGSFALELVHLYKITENKLYLQAAEKIANTLASHIREGNINYSPLPFKINVYSGQVPLLRDHDFTGTWIDTAGYTTNWAPTMQLFLDLIELNRGNIAAYKSGFQDLLAWMKAYPLKENKWGPFFEDVDWWSETQINAMTFARFIMEHREYFPGWKMDVVRIMEWVHKNFSNDKWEKYGVTVTNEQTVYQTPANSHSSRQAADELLFVKLSGDSILYENAIRELNWATYMVDFDGKNRFPQDEPWLTDGYGDYVRHYLRAMDAAPELTAAGEDHIISSTSVIQQADYQGNLKKYIFLGFENVDSSKVKLFYRSFDTNGTEKIRLKKKPSSILLDYKPLTENKTGEGYEWQTMQVGGLLTIRRENGKKVLLLQ